MTEFQDTPANKSGRKARGARGGSKSDLLQENGVDLAQIADAEDEDTPVSDAIEPPPPQDQSAKDAAVGTMQSESISADAAPVSGRVVLPPSLAALPQMFADRVPTSFARPPARPSGEGFETAAPKPQPTAPTAAAAPKPAPPVQAATQAATAPAAAGGQRPIAAAATVKPRHRGIMASFLILVLLPVLVTAIYLWTIAADEYASTVGFSVRTEQMSSSLDLLGGITRLSGAGSTDSDILYDYIHSQELVEDLDAEINLRAIYSKEYSRDPIFSFNPEGTVEDLVSHWESKVRITYDSSSRLMTLRVLAFTPEDAKMIATKILERSTKKINALSDEAREDATRYAREEMDRALERLKVARAAMTSFRTRTQMVDPVADLQGQTGILNSLQAQLAQSFVELDLLRTSANPNDPRGQQIEQRIVVIKNRIEEERRKFSEGGEASGGEDYVSMVADFERLSVDREFAVQAYRVALAAYDSAQAEAQRKSRYLAAHIKPTLAEEAEYPARWTLLGLTGFFLLMAWSIGILIFYSIRDRR